MSETFNPFDSGGYSPEGQIQQQEQVQETVESTQQTQVNESVPEEAPQPVVNEEIQENIGEQTNEQQEDSPLFEWPNDVAKDIYDKLVSGDISTLADMIYEQKVLSSLGDMSDEDVIKLNMAYKYPDLTPEEIEEEFISKYGVDEDIDESTLSDDEISQKKRQIEKQRKAVSREMKKDVREARETLSSMKQDISFPDILSQVGANQPAVNIEELVGQYLAGQEQEQSEAYENARQSYLSSIEDGLKSFEGFNVSYKDEDVQFDGKYSLTPEDKASLTNSLKDFDLEQFYGNRYFKDGRYDTKQLAEDVYFLQNRDKIVNAMVTQAVSKAKIDLLKSMKNIDYSDAPRGAASAGSNDEYSQMVAKMFSL